MKAFTPLWATWEIEPAVIVPWRLSDQSVGVGREDEGAGSRIDPMQWTLATSPIPSPFTPSQPPPATTPPTVQENPNELQHRVLLVPSSPPPPRSQPGPIMAFQRADPQPFIPRNLQWHEVENNVPVVRAVASSRPPTQNEDLAIVVFDPLPGIAIHFPNVDEILREFFAERRIHFTEIQPSHLGQALVRFAHIIDRDTLVALGPTQFGDVRISFTKHNEGRN